MDWSELSRYQLEALEVSIAATITQCAARLDWSVVDKLRDRKYQIQQELTSRN